MFFSPESSGVLRCGEGVSKRECIPDDLYHGIQAIIKEGNVKYEKVHVGITKYIDDVLDAVCLDSYS